MRKLLIKFLLISGIMLTSHQIYGAEKDKEKEVSPKSSRPAPSPKSKKSTTDDDLDKIDQEIKEKKQSYPPTFNAAKFQRILAAPLKKQDAQSARWYKTQRVQIPGDLCWVSLIVNDTPEREALIHVVHPLLARVYKRRE